MNPIIIVIAQTSNFGFDDCLKWYDFLCISIVEA